MPSPRTNGLGLRSNFCRGHFWVHSRYGPVTHSPPQGGFVGWLHPLRFLHECNPSYGGLAFTPVGLSPTEHASLCWTHSFAKIASATTVITLQRGGGSGTGGTGSGYSGSGGTGTGTTVSYGNFHGNYHLSFNPPEAWGLKYFASTTLLNGLEAPEPPEGQRFGSITVGFETDWLPTLDAGQRRIGFNGAAQEDLNKAPVYFKGQNPVGRLANVRIEKGLAAPMEIVGYVRDAAYYAVREPMHPTVYVPMFGNKNHNTLLLDAAGDPLALAPIMRPTVSEVRPDIRLINVQPQSNFLRWQMLR